MKSTIALALVAFLATLARPSSASAQLLSSPETEGYSVPAVFTFTIADVNGRPIEGAQVLIGESENNPFYGNVLVSDQEGHVPLPPNWLTEQPVTIEANGYIRATYLYLTPAVQTLKLRRFVGTKAAPTRFELKGNTTGFGKLKNDGTFDLGLVFQAVPRAELSSINFQSLISPETDHLTVFGQGVDIPSNVTLPDQTENYIFPLRFNKPAYRLYLPKGGTWSIATLHAQVPFKATADALQKGKPFNEIVNTFSFVEGSSQTLSLTQPSTTLDLTVNQTKYTKSIKFTAPAYGGGLDLIVLAMSLKNGAFYPTDVKTAAPSTSLQLWAPASAQVDGITLAAFRKAGADTIGAEADQYSAVALPNGGARNFEPIRLVEPPRVNQNQLVLDTPTPAADLTPVMTYAALSIVSQISKGTMKMETKQVVWDVWAPDWAMKIDLPPHSLPKIDPATQSLRWEVSFDAQVTGQTVLAPGPSELEKITHVSRSAVDLK